MTARPIRAERRRLTAFACHDGDMEAVNLDAMLARFTEHWSPKKIAQINDYDVRIVKVQGEFTWHRHTDTDEFFLVLDGQLTIQMRDRSVVLAPRELFVVPRGAEHCPRADVETAVLLLEPGMVVNTGDAGGELTAEVEELA
jgi:mannose-6-phosphate isomerase-like protein (cupin superfamily)